MLLVDRKYFIEAHDRGIDAKFISMCSFYDVEIMPLAASQKLHF